MSRWDKLLSRICALSKDIRFDELKKFWKATDMKCMHQEEAAVIVHFGKQDVNLLQYRDMNLSRESM